MLSHHTVAHAPDRLNEGTALFPQLLAKGTYVHVKGSGLSIVLIASDAVEQFIPGHHPGLVLQQINQQLKFLQCKLYQPAAA